MLVYDRTQRPHFHHLLGEFEEQSRQMLRELADRYDYLEESLLSEDTLVLASNLRQLGAEEEPPSGIRELLELENSYQLVNTLRKYLRFRASRNELLTRLLRTFSKCKFPYLRNVYKYMLMFLSAGAFVAGQAEVLR